jgi:enterochelin esterase-like enzyme
MTKDEALRLALKAMESFQNGTNGLYEGEFEEEITAIKAALEAKDSPVAWRTYTGRGYYIIDKTLEEAEQNWPDRPHSPLYTTPPQRKPLTDEEMKTVVEQELVNYWDGEYIDTTGARDCLTQFARAIEAKLRSKND